MRLFASSQVRVMFRVAIFAAVVGGFWNRTALVAEDYQYKFEQISIPKASGDEATLSKVSLSKASEYLENGSVAMERRKEVRQLPYQRYIHGNSSCTQPNHGAAAGIDSRFLSQPVIDIAAGEARSIEAGDSASASHATSLPDWPSGTHMCRTRWLLKPKWL